MDKKQHNQRGGNRPLKVAAYCRVTTAEQANDTKPHYSSIPIKDFSGQIITVKPRLMLYAVKDFMGRRMTIPGISLTEETANGEEPFAELTKSFGEFIGIKACAYVDTNNCPFADEFLKLGIARDTGYTKQSGFCIYPLWKFDEDFLRQIGSEEYEKYSQAYDNYMRGEIEEEEPEQSEETEEFSIEHSIL